LIKRRLEELAHIKQLGINPYPHKFDVTAKSGDIKDSYVDAETDEDKEKQKENLVSIAGRIMSIRKMGKASFCHIKDEQGRIQTYIKKDEIGEQAYDLFKLLDIGDIIGVKGYPFRTKTGEISVHAVEITLLTKTIHPLPVVKEEVT